MNLITLELMNSKTYKFALSCMGLLLAACSPKDEKSEALDIVSRHTICYEAPAKRLPTPVATDAPLLGNGSMSVAVAGQPEQQVFYLCRNDFWRMKSSIDVSFPAILGKIEVNMPGMEGASYHLEQRLADATTVATFEKDGQTVQYTYYVSATDDLFIMELLLQGKGTQHASVQLAQRGVKEIDDDEDRRCDFPSEQLIDHTADGTCYLSRAFTEDVDMPTQAVMAVRNLTGNTLEFDLKAGVPVRLVCSTTSNYGGEHCLQRAIDMVASLTPSALEKVKKAHDGWWRNYWEQSYVSIPDSVIEKHYFISLYGTGSCSRTPDFPPSIFGSWITQEVPWWNGDYHLNYNHMAPYYALYSANRLEQAEPYTNSMLAQIERGQFYSEKVCGIKGGIILPVGAGPLGIETTRCTPETKPAWIPDENVEEGGLFWGQKSNSAYAVPNMAMHFYTTWDKAYAEKTYPYVKGVATFWEHYLTKEGERYVIFNDAIHEGTVGTMNPILSLGMVRLVFQTAMDMSDFLGVDADKRAVWGEIREKMADYPLQVRNGRTVFRYTEKGVAWWDSNTLGIQHIYPAGQIGLDSDPKMLEIARNTIDELHRWKDYNGTNSFFPAAVRVGYSPDTILVKLHQYAEHTYPNGFQYGNPHGIENLSTTPNTINMMLCMGHQNVVRLFPVWPRQSDAHFEKIRVEGAFLVSARLKGGEVQPFTVVSERGRQLTLLNPWPGKRLKVTASDGHNLVLDGDRVMMPTVAGTTYRFEPEVNA